MDEKSHGKRSVIIAGRDKFSPTDKCIESVLNNSPEADEFIVVLGGAPPRVRSRLTGRFGNKVKLIFKEEFLNPAQGRNWGLKACTNKLAVVMDNDVVVHPGWLKHMLDCQKETGAAMVTPVVLEEENIIHTAGNDLYITYENGKAFGHKELCFHGMQIGESTNLKRREIDYGELHCQLVDTKAAISLGAFDENIQEVGECDAGLTWKKAGCKMYFEPKSVVFYMLYHPVRVEDLKFFIWRWNMDAILKGYEYFEKKWDLDITEHGGFRHFLLRYNQKVGFWARVYPSAFTMIIDKASGRLGKLPVHILDIVRKPWRNFLAKRLGYGSWLEYSK